MLLGKKKNLKPTGCRVFWRAFLFTLRFMVQFLLRQNPMQHCWINIYFRKTLWRRSDLVGTTPPTPHRPHQHDTTLWYFWRERFFIFFFPILFVIAVFTRDFPFTSACLAHQIIAICISKDFPTNACVILIHSFISFGCSRPYVPVLNMKILSWNAKGLNKSTKRKTFFIILE